MTQKRRLKRRRNPVAWHQTALEHGAPQTRSSTVPLRRRSSTAAQICAPQTRSSTAAHLRAPHTRPAAAPTNSVAGGS